jgi:hypothetical protein
MRQVTFADATDIFYALELDKDVCNDVLDEFTYGDDKTSYTLVRTNKFSDAIKKALEGHEFAETFLNNWKEYSIHNLIGVSYVNIEL